MNKEVDAIRPRVARPELLAKLLEIQSATWPNGLHRFAPFKRRRDGDYVIYRPVVWNPDDRSLHVLKIASNKSPKGPGVWEQWHLDASDKPLSDIVLVDDVVTPLELKKPMKELKGSCLGGFFRRVRTLQAFAYVDTVGDGDPENYMFNDLVVTNKEERSAALKFVVSALQQHRGFQSHVKQIFHKFTHFGGGESALAALSFRQGGKDQSRIGRNCRKPGQKSDEERRIQARNVATDSDKTYRRAPVRPCDERKFIRALTEHWAQGRVSLRETYDRMVLDDYAKWPKRLIPSFDAFKYHARKRLIAEYDLNRIRNGVRLSSQHNDARVGQSSFLTQGVIEVVDVDGFVAKIPVAVRIGKTIKRVQVTVIFSVSRLSGAIVGYELAIKGENAEAFRRCIASIFLSKGERAKELGIEKTDGLLSGNVDAIFVDNGAGASEEVIVAACDEMRLMRMLPPPGRGDYKGVGEGVNGIMVLLMAQEDGGYTRKTDYLSREIRRAKAKDKPITLERFERLLLLAIQHYNLCTNKKRLRTRAMRDAGIGITPAAIFKYTQAQRRGDAARSLLPREVYERFLPWQTRVCQRGLVRFMSMRYWSEELTEFFNEHARQPAKNRASLEVKVKRLDGHPRTLLWRKPDGNTSVLKLVEEDERSIGDVTWKGLEFLNEDDAWQEETLKPARRKSGNRLTRKQHGKVAEAERNRVAGEFGGLEGSTVRQARANADASRNAKRGKAQAEAYGIHADDVRVPDSPSNIAGENKSPAAVAYLRRLSAKLLDLTGRAADR